MVVEENGPIDHVSLYRLFHVLGLPRTDHDNNSSSAGNSSLLFIVIPITRTMVLLNSMSAQWSYAQLFTKEGA